MVWGADVLAGQHGRPRAPRSRCARRSPVVAAVTAGRAAPSAPALSAQAAAGKALFFDKSLSASGEQSCGDLSCAEPRLHRRSCDRPGPAGAAGRPSHGPAGLSQCAFAGVRHLTPAFFLDDDTPTGGFFRDGRASSLEVQAQQPFITEFEMANRRRGRGHHAPAGLAGDARTLRGGLRRGRCLPTRTRRSPTSAARSVAYETEAPEFSPLQQQVRRLAGRGGAAQCRGN